MKGKRAYARTLLLAVIGAALGWLGGLLWFSIAGTSYGDFGSSGEGIVEVARGIAVGALAGALTGFFWGRASEGPQVLIFAGCVVTAILFVVGVSYTGDWTNADGPGWSGRLGILGIPAAAGLLAVLIRMTRT